MKKRYVWMLLCALLLTACAAREEGAPAVKEAPPPAASSQEVQEGGQEEPAAELALYRQVLEDLWAVDPGLNGDISIIGVDLSATSLTEEEQTALAEDFAAAHGMELVQGTWEELRDLGYIDQEELYWAEGCHFSITEKEGEADSLSTLAFDAQKWRSGLGAYFFCDCTAVQAEDGTWEYTVAAEAIS